MASPLADIWRCRYFWLALVRMDLRQRYRRSVLGLGWSLVHPLVLTAILCVVFARAFQADLRDYVPRVLAGLAFWHYLTAVTQQGCLCFLHAEAYIRQWPTPLAIFPWRVALGNAVHFLPTFAVALGLAVVLKGWPGLVPLLSLVPTLAVLLVLGWAVASVAGCVNVLFRDAEHFLTIALQVLFYATPILYRPSDFGTGRLGGFISLNPLTAYLELLRAPLLEGALPSLSTWAIAVSSLTVVVALALLILRRMQRVLIFYL